MPHARGRTPRIRVSAPPESGLRRDRLLDVLRAAQAKLLLVTAPPGAGKSTLLTQAAATPGWLTAWVQPDPADGSAETLFGCMAAAVRHAVCGPVQPVSTADELLLVLEQQTTPVTIVVDDAHLLAGTAAEHMLARLIVLLPAGVRVLLAGRAELTAVADPARLAGVVFEVHPDELRFRTWEVEQLFRDHYRAALPPEEAAALARHTEGWAAGLAMFQLATADKPTEERCRAVARLWGRSRLLRSYLTANVLATLTADVSDFLVRSSAFGLLEGSLCDRLLGRSDSATVLRELAERQLFTVCCDENGWYYRYHQVLRTQLETMLAEQLGAEATRKWYGLAAALLEQAEHWPEAYRAYARAEDSAGGARVLRRWDTAHGDLVGVGEHDPWLALAEARRLRASGRLADACASYTEAVDRFDDPAMKRAAREESRLLAPLLGASAPEGPPTGMSWTEDLRRAARADPAALIRLAGDNPEPHWQLAVGTAAMLADDPQRCYAALRQAAEGEGFVALAARFSAVVVCTMMGANTVEQAIAELDELLPKARQAELPWLCRMISAARHLAGQDRAAALAIQAQCDADGDVWGALLIGMWLCVSLLRRAEPATTELLDAQVRCAALDNGVQHRWLTAMLADRSQFGPVQVWGGVSTTRYELTCFGRFSATVDGRELNWRSLRPKAQALFRLLCLRAGEPLHEEVLIEALWPGTAPEAGRHNLHVAISAIRKMLEPGRNRSSPSLLRRTGEAYQLSLPQGWDSDVARFERSLRQWRGGPPGLTDEPTAPLRATVDSYGGDLLVEDGPAEWVVADRERFRARAAHAATELAERELRGRRYPAAIEACRRALQIEPANDTGWRLLITAQRQAGNTAAAETIRRQYESMLDSLDHSGLANTSISLTAVDTERVEPLLATTRNSRARTSGKSNVNC